VSVSIAKKVEGMKLYPEPDGLVNSAYRETALEARKLERDRVRSARERVGRPADGLADQTGQGTLFSVRNLEIEF